MSTCLTKKYIPQIGVFEMKSENQRSSLLWKKIHKSFTPCIFKVFFNIFRLDNILVSYVFKVSCSGKFCVFSMSGMSDGQALLNLHVLKNNSCEYLKIPYRTKTCKDGMQGEKSA